MCTGVSQGAEWVGSSYGKTDPFFFSILLMLNVLPRWASSRIQIKSINKDTFCFHLKLSPPEGPQGGEVTAALITGRSLGLGEAPLPEACWPSVERVVGARGSVNKPGAN